MATVYITRELIERVKKRIDGMRKAERASDLPNIDKNYSVDASQLYNIGCWGSDHVHLIDKIPKDWLSKAEDSTISIGGTLDDGNTLVASVRFNGMTFAYTRPADSYWNKTTSELNIDYVRSLPEETCGRAELLERWNDAMVELTINERWKKVETDITEFLNKCKSLNEAVKLFPNVTMYIGHEDIERLNRKVERVAQRKAIVESYDTDGLTAAAIAAKLAQAS